TVDPSLTDVSSVATPVVGGLDQPLADVSGAATPVFGNVDQPLADVTAAAAPVVGNVDPSLTNVSATGAADSPAAAAPSGDVAGSVAAAAPNPPANPVAAGLLEHHGGPPLGVPARERDRRPKNRPARDVHERPVDPLRSRSADYADGFRFCDRRLAGDGRREHVAGSGTCRSRACRRRARTPRAGHCA